MVGAGHCQDTSSGLAWGVLLSECAYLPHNPASIFLASTVVDDVALGLIARGVPRQEATESARDMLNSLGISHLATRAPWTLSSGEAVMAGLAVVLVTNPRLLLLDEPLTALDRDHRDLLITTITDYQATTQAAVVLTHHPVESVSIPGFSEYVLTEQGLTLGRYTPTHQTPPRLATRPVEPDLVASIRDVSAAYDGRTVVDHVDIDVHRGDVILITGKNGAGKSTLIEALFDASRGQVTVHGQDLESVTPLEKPGLLAVVPSDPRSVFHTASVAEELAWADRVAGVEKGFTRLTLSSILPEPWHQEVLGSSEHTHPRDLSRGQQAALAVALQLSHKPTVIALDEPTRGLDESARHAFAEVVACVVETGLAVIMATHHEDSDGLVVTQRFVLENGQLSPVATAVVS